MPKRLKSQWTNRIAGINATVSWPSTNPTSGDNASSASAPKGVTFLLPGATVQISEYNGLRDAILLEHHHIVVSLYLNVLWPLRGNHRKHAQNVKRVFDELRSMYAFLPNSYSIVGHSVGGKIALLVASIIDPARVSAVLALDPVDINPVEFTNAKGHNLPLNDSILHSDFEVHAGVAHVVNHKDEPRVSKENRKRIPILLTCTDGGIDIPANHNAKAIGKVHPATTCYYHKHADHMAYCDNGGGLEYGKAGVVMPDVGTKEGNKKAREAACDLIRVMFGS